MILAIETSAEICSTAIVHSGKILAERSVNEKNIHSERLMMLIDEAIKEASISKKNLDAIAVSIGPGSFTGLRIGLSSAKGIALAVGIPIIAVPTLDGIAEQYRRTRISKNDEIFCALIDAKRHESFYCFYNIVLTDISAISEYSIKLKDEILGDAAARNAVISQQPCRASAVGILAERKRENLLVEDFSLLEPMYLREFIVTPPKNKLIIE